MTALGVSAQSRLLPGTPVARLELQIAAFLLHRGAGRHAGHLPVLQIVRPDQGNDIYLRVAYAPQVVQSLKRSPIPGSVEEFFDLIVETLQVPRFIVLRPS